MSDLNTKHEQLRLARRLLNNNLGLDALLLNDHDSKLFMALDSEVQEMALDDFAKEKQWSEYFESLTDDQKILEVEGVASRI